jgi:uncharacterized membrane protein
MRSTRGLTRSQGLLSLFFIGAGVNHFASPGFYRRIVPPGFGDPETIVAVSGVAEVVAGAAVLPAATRRASGWAIIALLLAVFPANIDMAVNPGRSGYRIPRVLLWLRLPLQPLMMWWAWSATRSRS